MNDEDFTAQLNVSLASIDLVEKKFADGDAQARLAIAGYEKSNSAGNGAWAQAVLARNLLGAGKLEEAQSTLWSGRSAPPPAPGRPHCRLRIMK